MASYTLSAWWSYDPNPPEIFVIIHKITDETPPVCTPYDAAFSLSISRTIRVKRNVTPNTSPRTIQKEFCVVDDDGTLLVKSPAIKLVTKTDVGQYTIQLMEGKGLEMATGTDIPVDIVQVNVCQGA